MTDDAVETPPCAVCGQRRQGTRSRHHLTHGVSLWLCETHLTDTYLRRHGGRDFVERLASAWAASDSLTQRKRKALRAYLRRLDEPPPARVRPGSYSWPALRREAERRFAAGEAPNTVIGELRATYADGPSIVPSLRTMRRWFTQARWLTTSTGRHDGAGTLRQPRTGPLTPREQFVNLMLGGYAYLPRAPSYATRGP